MPFPQTSQGQYDFKALTPVVRDAGGSGIFYWGAFWSQSPKWLVAPDGKDDDASRRSPFDDGGQATKGLGGLNWNKRGTNWRTPSGCTLLTPCAGGHLRTLSG
ncbi:arabinogalactan endo-1,4-beta-galactosidase [Deinococcus hopiensis KR-140]|uniref:Arabinogalactan endo-1,4-beta-galactosidase n=1 Tax=Deinococcus hopiensis KR-140 TaxID=695939 RepID=A0A1W1UKD7_9DEIO|nr:arabinogalactan endo-1,4-beta-galactosidase [Deinococcus hopiensis KR-140]